MASDCSLAGESLLKASRTALGALLIDSRSEKKKRSQLCFYRHTADEDSLSETILEAILSNLPSSDTQVRVGSGEGW